MAVAVKAALVAAFADMASPPPVYDYDEIPGDQYGETPGSVPKAYVVIDISRRFTESRRYSGEVTLPGYRLGTRYCHDSVDNVRELQRRVTAALESQIIEPDLGPFDFEVESEPIHRDSLGFTGVDDWTF
jgi:hypothetical protein